MSVKVPKVPASKFTFFSGPPFINNNVYLTKVNQSNSGGGGGVG